MQAWTSGNNPPKSNRRVLLGLAIVGVLGCLGILLLIHSRSPEPIYGERTLTQWLLNSNADFVWMPNDFYGHIHDELWYRVVDRESEANFTAPAAATGVDLPDERTIAVRQIGTNGLPELIRLMSARPTLWAKLRDGIATRLPAPLAGLAYSPLARNLVEREISAACDGFWILRSNAEPALPALSNLLFHGRAPMQLTCAIAAIGPKGEALLTNALSWRDAEVRDTAALALGFQYQAGTSAVPALLNCVERGDASYQILGALGRIGCEDPRLVSALVRLLEDSRSQTNGKVSTDMAFLLLGLQRERARAAAPLIIAQYQLVAEDTNQPAARRFYRHLLQAVAPDLETQLPPPQSAEEQSNDWP